MKFKPETEIGRKIIKSKPIVNNVHQLYRISQSRLAIKEDYKLKEFKIIAGMEESTLSLSQHKNLHDFIHSENFWNGIFKMESEVLKYILIYL